MWLFQEHSRCMRVTLLCVRTFIHINVWAPFVLNRPETSHSLAYNKKEWKLNLFFKFLYKFRKTYIYKWLACQLNVVLKCLAGTNYNNFRKKHLNRKLKSGQQWLLLKCNNVLIYLCIYNLWIKLNFKPEQVWVMSVMHKVKPKETTRGCCWTR